jgi:pimeloyl-ACP methyl ester carboxylesterase
LADYEDRFYESSDGLSLYCRDYDRSQDDRAPILCLPGLTRNARDFDVIAEHLATNRRVVCSDFRGRGRSQYDKVTANYVPPTYANDVVTLLDSLSIEKAVLLGTSLGGMVSMLLAATVPTRIDAVILNDIGPVVDPAGLARIAGYAGRQGPVESWRDAAEQARSTIEIAFPDKSEEWWISFARKAYRENDDGTIVLDYDPGISEALRSTSGPTDPNAGWSLFEALMPIPTLLLRGETSDILSREVADEMRRRKPDLVIAEICGVGHAPTLEEPDAIAAIDAFLATRGTGKGHL